MKRFFSWGVFFSYVVLVGAFFYQTIFYGKLPVPTDTLVGLYHPWRDTYAASYPRGIPFRNFLVTDPVRQQIPWRKIGIDSWKQGLLPSENPYSFMGTPLDANIQAAPFYPLNFLFFVLDFPIAWTVLIILQPLLAGICMYVYLRRLQLSIQSAILGTISWAFGGFAISWMTWGTIVHTALWLPLMLLAVDELTAVKKNTLHYMRWSVCLLFGIVMSVLAGHIQVAAYTLVLCLMYFAYKVNVNFLWKPIGWALVVGGVAVLITAVQWIPLLGFIAESGRVASLGAWKNAGWFLPWQHTIQFVAPDFFGNPATLNYWGEWNYGEFIGYIGVIPFIFALSAFFLTGVPRFFSVVLGISYLLMTSNPISRLPYMFQVPILGVLQPTRLMVLLDFSLAVLVAFGFERYIKGKVKALYISTIMYGVVLMLLWAVVLWGRVFFQDSMLLTHFIVAKRNLVVPTMIFVGFLVWRIGVSFIHKNYVKRIVFGILIAMCIFDLFRFGWKYTPFTHITYFFPKTSIIDFLQNQQKPFRIMSLDDRIMPPNVSAYYGIESIEGYDPIAPMMYENFLAASERGTADFKKLSGFNRIYTAHNVDSVLLPYTNVKYVLALADVHRPFLKEVMREGETRLYEYTNSLPRVYLSDRTQRVSTPDDALGELFSPISIRNGITDGSKHIIYTPLSSDEVAHIRAYSSNSMRIITTATSQRLLIVLNRYDRRWTAIMDKVTNIPIGRANYLFMGIVVPPGTHDIILSYR